MQTTHSTNKVEELATLPGVEFSSEVLRQIRQHARGSMNAEICGVLLGNSSGGATCVTARIEGVGAVEAGANVTFTQETWAHIFRVRDAQHSDLSIVGWYHSHPGFGVFLSEYDIFIHENFFSGVHQVAWVFDPHSDEEGCFGWVGKSVKPLRKICIRQNLRGQAEAASGVSMPGKSGRADTAASVRWRRTLAIALFLLTLTVVSLAAGALLRPLFGKLAPQAWNWVCSASSAAAVPAPPLHAAPLPLPSVDLPSPTAVSTPEVLGNAPVYRGEKSAPSPAPPVSRKKSKTHGQPER